MEDSPKKNDRLASLFGGLFVVSSGIASQPVFDEKTRAYAGAAALITGGLFAFITNKPPPPR